MVDYFKPGALPGGDLVRAPTDLTTYEHLYETAKSVLKNCVEDYGIPGWKSTGEYIQSPNDLDFSSPAECIHSPCSQ